MRAAQSYPRISSEPGPKAAKSVRHDRSKVGVKGQITGSPRCYGVVRVKLITDLVQAQFAWAGELCRSSNMASKGLNLGGGFQLGAAASIICVVLLYAGSPSCFGSSCPKIAEYGIHSSKRRSERNPKPQWTAAQFCRSAEPRIFCVRDWDASAHIECHVCHIAGGDKSPGCRETSGRRLWV